MILLITASANGPQCARELRTASHTKAELAPDIRTALALLREKEYVAVVLDDSLSNTSEAQIEVVLKHLGTAVPVFVNLGVSCCERVVREVLLALRRVDQEKAIARQSVQSELRSQLKGDLTGILLSAQQALDVPTLPGTAAL